MRFWLWLVLPAMVVAALPAGAEGAPPCAPGTAAQPSWDALDLESLGPLVATHTIRVTVDLNGAGDDTTVAISVPPGATQIDPNSRLGKQLDLGNERVAFIPDAGGPLQLTATWDQDDGTGGGGTCTATAGTTLQVRPAQPLRLSKLTKRRVSASQWEWETRLGPFTDRRPVEVRVRSRLTARLPKSSQPFKKTTLDLRADTMFDPPERHLRTPRMFTAAHGDREALTLRVKPRGVGIRERSVGYELQLVQAGRQIARVRAAGRCSDFGCVWRKLKIQR